MEQRDGIMNHNGFITQTFIIFGVTVIVIMGIGLAVGGREIGFSTLFRSDMQGIAYRTLLELLLSSVCISAIERLFHNERYFGRLSYLVRTVLMLICIIVLTILFIIYFGWFPAYAWQGWIGFAVSFSICFGVSTAAMMAKTKRENRLYEERLAEYKKRYQDKK